MSVKSNEDYVDAYFDIIVIIKSSSNIIVEEVMTKITPHTNTMLDEDIVLNVIVKGKVQIASLKRYKSSYLRK